MKKFPNPRKIAKTALIAAGCISIMLASGEDNRPIAEWLVAHCGLIAMAILMFYAESKIQSTLIH